MPVELPPALGHLAKTGLLQLEGATGRLLGRDGPDRRIGASLSPLGVLALHKAVDEVENAAALVGAGMLSVLIFPLLGFSRLRRAQVIPEDSTLYVSDDIDAPDPPDD